MSSIVGAKAISLATTPGAVTELRHVRVFAVNGSGGRVYTVVLNARAVGAELTAHGRDVCTCPAGQRGARCSHTAAARLTIERERREAAS